MSSQSKSLSAGSPAPDLFAWDADHEAGVTSDRSEAIRHVNQALTDAPSGTAGIVRRVTVGMSGNVEYVELGTVVTASVDADSGTVVWTGGQAEADQGSVALRSAIPAFTVTRLPGGTWRARHVVDHRLVVERGSWSALEAACCAARVARGLRAASAKG